MFMNYALIRDQRFPGWNIFVFKIPHPFNFNGPNNFDFSMKMFEYHSPLMILNSTSQIFCKNISCSYFCENISENSSNEVGKRYEDYCICCWILIALEAIVRIEAGNLWRNELSLGQHPKTIQEQGRRRIKSSAQLA